MFHVLYLKYNMWFHVLYLQYNVWKEIENKSKRIKIACDTYAPNEIGLAFCLKENWILLHIKYDKHTGFYIIYLDFHTFLI